ncbi:hypothetical protein PRIPAC_86245 [Pristionchus pacificus]|uniref:Uncharacterized protein n=1 Tax=Pristionchus pacificus TaxID=54126 RepID=A0A2A6BP18_PRIPA|nr:hypothetical protein PRIPAC_86245 [Pristionchus pacificus]|eukprot:PDM67511.1 hypothetical protein PRIPAC_48928 [Pristionchus pacificus]
MKRRRPELRTLVPFETIKCEMSNFTSEFTQSQLVAAHNVLLYANVAGFSYFGRDHENAVKLMEEEPLLIWLKSRGGTLFLFGPPGDAQYFKWELFFLAFSILLITPFLCFFTVDAMINIAQTTSRFQSGLTQKMARRMFHIFLIQCLGAFICYIVPLVVMLSFMIIDASTVHGWICATLRIALLALFPTLFSINGPQTCIFFIFKNPTYRKSELSRDHEGPSGTVRDEAPKLLSGYTQARRMFRIFLVQGTGEFSTYVVPLMFMVSSMFIEPPTTCGWTCAYTRTFLLDCGNLSGAELFRREIAKRVAKNFPHPAVWQRSDRLDEAYAPPANFLEIEDRRLLVNVKAKFFSHSAVQKIKATGEACVLVAIGTITCVGKLSFEKCRDQHVHKIIIDDNKRGRLQNCVCFVGSRIWTASLFGRKMAMNSLLHYGLEFDRDHLIDFSMQIVFRFQFYLPIFALFTWHPLMQYLLIFDNKAMKKNLKVLFIFYHLALFINEWSFSMALRLYPIHPYAALYCEGPLCRGGLDKPILPPIEKVSKYFLSRLYTYPDYCLMSRRLKRFRVHSPEHRNPSHFAANGQQTENIDKYPDLAWLTQRGGTIFMFGPPGAPQYLKYELIWLGVSLCIIAPFIAYIVVDAMICYSKLSSNFLSGYTKAMATRIYRIFLVQCATSIIFFDLPLTFLAIFMIIDPPIPGPVYALGRVGILTLFNLNSHQFCIYFISNNPTYRKVIARKARLFAQRIFHTKSEHQGSTTCTTMQSNSTRLETI